MKIRFTKHIYADNSQDVSNQIDWLTKNNLIMSQFNQMPTFDSVTWLTDKPFENIFDDYGNFISY